MNTDIYRDGRRTALLSCAHRRMCSLHLHYPTSRIGKDSRRREVPYRPVILSPGWGILLMWGFSHGSDALVVVITRSQEIKQLVQEREMAAAWATWRPPGSVTQILVADLSAFTSRTDRESLIQFSSKHYARTIVIDDIAAPREVLARIHASDLWVPEEAEHRLLRLLDEESGHRLMIAVFERLTNSFHLTDHLREFLEVIFYGPDVPTIAAATSRLRSSAPTLRRHWRRSMIGKGIRLQDLVRAVRLTRSGSVRCSAGNPSTICRCLRCLTDELCSTPVLIGPIRAPTRPYSNPRRTPYAPYQD